MKPAMFADQDSRTGNAASNEEPTAYVCWSRMQAEAGQALDLIVARKELERQAGDGIFFWGVGNAPSTAIKALARTSVPVQVVFSVMKSRPKATDAAPSRVVAWRRFVDAHGAERPLPEHALVTSRGDSDGGPKRAHYALVCYSAAPLALVRGQPFDHKAFRNVGGTGAPVGPSQVTALLRRVQEDSPADYEVNLSACLTGSYWVRLTDPVELDVAKLAKLSSIGEGSLQHWPRTVGEIRSGPSVFANERSSGTLL